MKQTFRIVVTILLLAFTAGCTVARDPRVVRLSSFNQGKGFMIRVNQSKPTQFTPDKLGNIFQELSLRHGDLMLYANNEDPELGASDCFGSVLSSCSSNGVALYLYPVDKLHPDVFEIPVYHWATPYDSPFDLDSARFFFEGERLGLGKNGFLRMLDDISSHGPRSVLVLGCHVRDTSLSGIAVPFFAYEDQLDRALGTGHSFLVDMTEFDHAGINPHQ
jgi:hypothetical protein